METKQERREKRRDKKRVKGMMYTGRNWIISYRNAILKRMGMK